MPNNSHSPIAEAAEGSATPAERTNGWRSVFSLAPVYRTAQRLIGADSFRHTLVSDVLDLDTDDRVFVNKLSYRLHDPNRGDVVVLHQVTGASERDLIKRVIGLPGESVEMRNCAVLIDGRVLNEPYLDPEVVTPTDCGGDYALDGVVPDNHVFVMGDNRGGSQDSRVIGPISEDDLVGRAFVVFWPQSHWQWL